MHGGFRSFDGERVHDLHSCRQHPGRDDIADAPNAAIRKKMIEELAGTDTHLYLRYREAAREAEATTHFVRGGRYPLTATGKINTYSVFAETMRTVEAALQWHASRDAFSNAFAQWKQPV